MRSLATPQVPKELRTILLNQPTLLEERFRDGYSAMRDRPGKGMRFSSLAGDDLLYILYLFARGYTDWSVGQQVRVRKRHITEWRKKLSLSHDLSVYPASGFVVPVECAYPRERVRYFCRYCGLHSGRQDVITEHAYVHVFAREAAARPRITVEGAESIAWAEGFGYVPGPADDDRLSPYHRETTWEERERMEAEYEAR